MVAWCEESRGEARGFLNLPEEDSSGWFMAARGSWLVAHAKKKQLAEEMNRLSRVGRLGKAALCSRRRGARGGAVTRGGVARTWWLSSGKPRADSRWSRREGATAAGLVRGGVGQAAVALRR